MLTLLRRTHRETGGNPEQRDSVSPEANCPASRSLTGTGIYDFGILSIASSHGHPIPIYPARENAR